MAITPEERNQKLFQIKTYWSEVLKTTDYSSRDVIGKLYYTPSGQKEPIIRCFDNELEKGILVEFCGFEFEPIKKEREVFILPITPDYASKFAFEKGTYFIPVSLLTPLIGVIDVSRPKVAEKIKDTEIFSFETLAANATAKASYAIDNETTLNEINSFTEISSGITPPVMPMNFFDTALDDAHYSAMTIRDIYSIIHNKPVSEKTWLNKLILKNS